MWEAHERLRFESRACRAALDAHLGTQASTIARRKRFHGDSYPNIRTDSKKKGKSGLADGMLASHKSGSRTRKVQRAAMRRGGELQSAILSAANNPGGKGVVLRLWECSATLAGLRTIDQVKRCLALEAEADDVRPASFLRHDLPFALWGGGRMRQPSIAEVAEMPSRAGEICGCSGSSVASSMVGWVFMKASSQPHSPTEVLFAGLNTD